MVQTTPNAGLRYPEATDDVQLWTHFENLAEDVDDALSVHMCKLVAQSPQSIPSGALTVLTFAGSSEAIDTDGWHSTSVNTSRITVTRAGIYQVRVNAPFTFNTTLNYAEASIRQNGSVVGSGGNLAPTTANNVNKLAATFTDEYLAAAGDYFEAAVFQASTGAVAQTLQTGTGAARFSVRYLGPT